MYHIILTKNALIKECVKENVNLPNLVSHKHVNNSETDA